MKFSSIQSKIATLAGMSLFLTAAILVSFGVISSQSNNSFVSEKVSALLDQKTRNEMQNLASAQAGQIRSEFENALDAARTMAGTFATLADPKGAAATPPELRRQQLNDILLATLKQNPRLNGTYSAWEPDALDSQDEQFKGKRETGTDNTGRFLPYWTRDASGKIALQPLVEYDSRELHPNGVMKGGWYIGPMENGLESVLDPLPYIVQGKDVLLATLSVPIKINGKFSGVAGTDFNLDFVEELAKQVDASLFDGQSDIVILSYKGLVVAHSGKPELVGKTFSSQSSSWEQDLQVIQGGKSSVFVDEKTGNLRVFAPIKLGNTGKPWSVLVEIPIKVALAEATALSNDLSARNISAILWQVGVGLAVVLLALGGMWVVAGGIARPIRASAEFAEGIARGDFEQTLDVVQTDEVGALADALRKMLEDLKQMIAQRAADQAQAEEERRKGMLQLADELETGIGKVVAAVGGGATKMTETARSMSSTASETSLQATDVAATAEQASANVQTVAAATEELSSSIREIGRQISQSAEIAREAVNTANRANQQVLGLTATADKIGAVVQLIQDIASQTNLLALNATIEAARAGDAGKGFAVVAGEVKSLANQTARATEDISGQITEMQRVTRDTAQVIQGIGSIIGRINDITTTIASAMVEQGAATEEISRNVNEAAQGTRSVSETITSVRHSTEQTGLASETVLTVSGDLSNEAERLRKVVAQFLERIRSN